MNDLLKMAIDFADLTREARAEIDQDGNQRWVNAQGQLHREDGPAIIYANGASFWYRDGELDTRIRK